MLEVDQKHSTITTGVFYTVLHMGEDKRLSLIYLNYN